MSHTQRPHRSETARIDGEPVTVRVFRSDPEFAGRIEIEANETWTFGVDADGVARLHTTTEPAEFGADIAPPEWVLDLLAGFDGCYVEEVRGF